MKTLITVSVLAAAAALSGCAYDNPAYANRAVYPAQPADASQWHTVSVTPVPLGTGERLAATSGTGSATQYSSQPIVTQPVYVQQPVYYPAPVYYAPSPYYYSPVSIDLGFGFGRGWGGGWGHHRGGRSWTSVGIGTHIGR